ncbi:aminoglycoside phosphotransferase family protein [Xanthomonas theicola]|uniref:Aminoglycoside phosphotransferase n=1 Tax=Xanthomonas theicola TaxID=56464 RepID=A0A2S6ZKD1_9XANT|nr:phosphotransferase [Xanthomonas theicola]PPT92708.1 aminoglycoside phosphotransferase [Xanthomonas theicola]QNH24373.1 phosphotransferase [Xanthomonas theicola]
MSSSSDLPDAQDARAERRLRWARSALGDAQATLRRASIDAGWRSYWRSHGTDPSRVLMDSPPGLEDVRPWLRMHALLRHGGVRVPAILAQDVDAGFLLLEDLGGPTMAQTLDAASADAQFDAALGQLLRLQAIVPPPQLGVFGEALLQRDAGLFDEWFLQRHLALALDAADRDALHAVQRQLMDNALAQPQVLVHRDFMPRNLMPVADGPAVLDFQDCVRGPVAYDPISLFKDTTVSWPLARIDAWLTCYHARALQAGIAVPPLARFLRDAEWMGVQRHLKNLGIFARLHYRDGKAWYLDNVPRFIGYLDEVLPRHHALQPLAQLLHARIKPALARRAAAGA